MVLINRVTAPQATEGACFDMQHFILCITAPASTISFCFPASKGNVTLVLPSHMPEGVGIHAQCPLVKALWDYRIMMGKTPGDLICALLLWRKKQPNVGGGGGAGNVHKAPLWSVAKLRQRQYSLFLPQLHCQPNTGDKDMSVRQSLPPSASNQCGEKQINGISVPQTQNIHPPKKNPPK
jgi:hypothetical protein